MTIYLYCIPGFLPHFILIEWSINRYAGDFSKRYWMRFAYSFTNLLIWPIILVSQGVLENMNQNLVLVETENRMTLFVVREDWLRRSFSSWMCSKAVHEILEFFDCRIIAAKTSLQSTWCSSANTLSNQSKTLLLERFPASAHSTCWNSFLRVKSTTHRRMQQSSSSVSHSFKGVTNAVL